MSLRCLNFPGFSLLHLIIRNALVSRRYVAFMLSYVVFPVSSPREIIKSLIAG